jgi:hypothetical protein
MLKRQNLAARSQSRGPWIWSGIVIACFMVGAAVVVLSGKPDKTPNDPKTSGVRTSPIDPKSVGWSYDTRQGVR